MRASSPRSSALRSSVSLFTVLLLLLALGACGPALRLG
jgi:hypothetical protein